MSSPGRVAPPSRQAQQCLHDEPDTRAPWVKVVESHELGVAGVSVELHDLSPADYPACVHTVERGPFRGQQVCCLCYRFPCEKHYPSTTP